MYGNYGEKLRADQLVSIDPNNPNLFYSAMVRKSPGYCDHIAGSFTKSITYTQGATTPFIKPFGIIDIGMMGIFAAPVMALYVYPKIAQQFAKNDKYMKRLVVGNAAAAAVGIAMQLFSKSSQLSKCRRAQRQLRQG